MYILYEQPLKASSLNKVGRVKTNQSAKNQLDPAKNESQPKKSQVPF